MIKSTNTNPVATLVLLNLKDTVFLVDLKLSSIWVEYRDQNFGGLRQTLNYCLNNYLDISSLLEQTISLKASGYRCFAFQEATNEERLIIGNNKSLTTLH
jgi:hypothetical protein